MRCFKRCCFLFLLALMFSPLYGTGKTISYLPASGLTDQPRDSFGVKFFTGEFFQQASRSEKYDLKNFENYYFRNYLGNIGQAVNPYYACQPVSHIGFNYFQNDFAPNLISDDSVHYYDAHHPYTRLYFVTGQKKEASFSFIHSQNITKNLNFAAYFCRIRSDGTYFHNSSNLTSMYLSSNYKSPGKRYCLLGNIIYNVDKPFVNGGIQSDSAFQTGTALSQLGVNLAQAQRLYRNRSVSVRQFFNLGFRTKPSDSTQTGKFVPVSAFTWSFKASDEAITYVDLVPKQGYYRNIYNDSTITRDSVYFYRIKNTLGWTTWATNRNGNNRRWGGFINAEHELIELKQYSVDTLRYTTVFNNFSAHAGLFNYLDSASLLIARLSAEYCFMGYNAGDYRGELYAEKITQNRKFSVGGEGIVSLKKPDYMTLYYYSNNFRWQNSFSREGINSAKLFLRSDKYFFEVGGFARQYTNLVFYSWIATPWQMAYPVNLIGGYVYKELNLGSWTFRNRITYQFNSVPGPVSVPEWVTEHSLFFHHRYKELLDYQAGVDVFYFSSYFGKTYMPATGQFYEQNDTKIGNYPFLDLFINVQIKTVRLFVKYEHVNSGYPSYTFYVANHYPAPERALKFGLTWIFNN